MSAFMSATIIITGMTGTIAIGTIIIGIVINIAGGTTTIAFAAGTERPMEGRASPPGLSPVAFAYCPAR